MQISQPAPPKPGEYVFVRRARWRVLDVIDYRDVGDCRLFTLAGTSPPHIGLQRRLLAPFDVFERVTVNRRARFVRPSFSRRALRGLLADATPPGGLRTVARARVDLMPHQLEPALAIVRGAGSRVLIADEVGLGKTIQAAIIVAELRARHAADRVLVLTPAGLREQWAQELATRFAIDASVADAATLRRTIATLPIGVNPWRIHPVTIASVDYVKRPEVLPSVLACRWDVVIVDEAHGVSGDSDRHDGVAALTARAPYVVLLTATPHNGDRESFAALCGLGALGGDSLLVFHRTRAAIRGAARRRVHAIRIRPTPDESRMHAALARYTAAVCDEHADGWLAASVLHKRALSSAWSLARSIERRLDTLATPDHLATGEQLMLPLGNRDGELSSADEPPSWPGTLALADSSRERRLLQSVLAAARLASTHESKLTALVRLLRRAGEPAIVFTEYRDTLLHVQRTLGVPASVLHGGLTRTEREWALRDFAQGRRQLLLATDAAGEGLNLHAACRLVINLELPWNPMKLEQRIGRVDRIGQRRTVHAFDLIAQDTGELRILDRLRTRLARASEDIRECTSAAPGDDEERTIARLAITGSINAEEPPPPPREDLPLTRSVNLGELASREAQRLSFARTLIARRPAACSSHDESGVPILRIRRPLSRGALGSRMIVLYALPYEDGCGRRAEQLLVPFSVCLGASAPRLRRRDVNVLLRAIERDVERILEGAWCDVADQIVHVNRTFSFARLERERHILAALTGAPATPQQCGLFDRRIERELAAALADHDSAVAEGSARIAAIEHSSILAPASPHPVLVVVR